MEYVALWSSRGASISMRPSAEKNRTGAMEAATAARI